MLLNENKILVNQCSNLKALMINYEKESMVHRLESNVSKNVTNYHHCHLAIKPRLGLLLIMLLFLLIVHF